MRKNRYDVIVVGCGPGGATAGKYAALGGAETLIVEQKRQLGFPVHDSMAIIYSRSEMEEVTGEKIDPAAIYSQADGLAYISPSGNRGKPQLLSDGIFVNRQLFEKTLAIGAVRAGAEIMLHTRVIGLTKEKGVVTGVVVRDGAKVTTVGCSMVIAADGSFQHVARMAGMKIAPGQASVKLGCEFVGVKGVKNGPRLDDIYLDPAGKGSYGTVVPYTEDWLLIGHASSPALHKERKSLKRRLDEFLEHLERLGHYGFTNASPVNMIVGGHRIGLVPKLAVDGLMLVGDAAGAPHYGSQWGGSGLMVSASWTGRFAGQVAAETVRKGVKSGDVLDAEYRSVLENSLKGQRDLVFDGMKAYKDIRTLSPEQQDRIVAELGQEVAALHFYSKGCLASPLSACLEPIQKWLLNENNPPQFPPLSKGGEGGFNPFPRTESLRDRRKGGLGGFSGEKRG